MNVEDAWHITELEDQITDLTIQNRTLSRKLAAVATLMDEWSGYCLQGHQPGRLVAEVRELLAGRAVHAGTQLIQP